MRRRQIQARYRDLLLARERDDQLAEAFAESELNHLLDTYRKEERHADDGR